jgi:hypothetical protein
LREAPLNSIRPTLLALLTGAALLLLIACANVATLLLARSVVRARETAIRVALGARRHQLALRYVAEGALVSLAGAAAGVVLSAMFVRQMLDAASEFVPQADDIGIDWMVLAFSVAVALATGVLAGLAPLWQAARTPPNAVLTEGVRASAAAPVRRLSQAFVVAESPSPSRSSRCRPFSSSTCSTSGASRWGTTPVGCSRSTWRCLGQRRPVTPKYGNSNARPGRREQRR